MLGLQKVVLSSTPAAHDFVALAIYGEGDRLAFCKCGDDKWTSLQTSSIGFSDIIFYEGKFYAICPSHLVVCDLESLPNFEAHHVKAPQQQCSGIMWYLVGSPTYGLLTVSRRYAYFKVATIDNETSIGYRTTAFKVYKFKKRQRRAPKWTKITESPPLPIDPPPPSPSARHRQEQQIEEQSANLDLALEADLSSSPLPLSLVASPPAISSPLQARPPPPALLAAFLCSHHRAPKGRSPLFSELEPPRTGCRIPCSSADGTNIAAGLLLCSPSRVMWTLLFGGVPTTGNCRGDDDGVSVGLGGDSARRF
ncbi:hypothetical protein Tsubulata_050006 [Turnera subulata]|uniref:KIB1-4 beta-propeller domain-containing protein n=1 Tax=Turnera subulata TaxID=218843 RepID=A0A9Q0GFX1_9ROSI|nr:hypothetical protein Tsubulata_050006 [Turnera subulata]